MIQKILIANWKMNPQSRAAAKDLVLKIKKGSKNLGEMRLVIAPSFVHITDIGALLSKTNISLGSQNVSAEKEGAQTGEVSVNMLKDANVSYVILGHSERRAMGEGDELVAKKLQAVVSGGLSAILCVGERARDDEGHYLEFLGSQLRSALKGLSPKYQKNIVIAYEPIWAIGKNATRAVLASELHEMSIFIRKTLLDLFGKTSAYKIPIVYGGSVDAGNAADLLTNGAVDGFLVGRASLDAKMFGELIAITKSSGSPKIARV